MVESTLFENIRIPKIIHQTWKDENVSDDFIMLADTWRNLHPDWEYILWTDEMNRAFIEASFPDFLEQYDSYKFNIQRVDAVRYFILLKLGGLFIDADFECLENVEALISLSRCTFGLEPMEHCKQFGKEMIICNAFMACRPDEDFFKAICASLYNCHGEDSNLINRVLETTGPFALTKVYQHYPYKEQIKLLPSCFLYPLTAKEARAAVTSTTDMDIDIQKKVDAAYAVHYFFGTWYS